MPSPPGVVFALPIPPPPVPQMGGGRTSPPPPMGIVNWGAVAELLLDGAELGWKSVHEFAERKAAGLRSELIAKAAATAAAGSALPFPWGFVAGAAGVQIVPPGSYTWLDYAALSYALQSAAIRGRPILQAVGGLGGRIVRFTFGPYAVLGTGAAVGVYQILDSNREDDSLAEAILRGITTGGIQEFGGTGWGGIWANTPGWQRALDSLDGKGIAALIRLVPFWQKDP